jgi:hypothetical protein
VQTLALLIVSAAGLWLVAVAVLMAVRPVYSLHLYDRMLANLEAGSHRQNLIEQGLRLLAGAALIVRSPASKLPMPFEIFGWLLVVSSLFVMVAPIRWHAAYGSWWGMRLTSLAVRILSPVPAIVGVGLIYAAI